MLTLKAHFDGKTIVPDEPVDLPVNQQLHVILLETVASQANRIESAPAKPRTDWQSLIGIGLPLPENHTPRFTSNDQLWEKDKQPMVIDSSAILAIYFQEPTALWVSQQIDAAERVLMSTVNLTESLMRIRDKQPAKADELERQLLASKTEFIAPDTTHAIIAARARLQYPLNLGDCFAYALAKTQNLPLLTLDRDFRSTDITVILPPTP